MTSSEKHLVLGSGISALIYLYYHPESQAIGGEVRGGLFAKQKCLGPQYLWVDKYSGKLLRDLCLPRTKKKIRIGYYYNGKVFSREKLSTIEYNRIRSRYALNTRGTVDKGSYMSQGVGSFKAYDLGVDTLVQRLLQEVEARIMPFNAIDIDIDNRLVHSTNGTYFYSKLISTVPAPLFLRLAGYEHLVQSLQAKDKYYLTIDNDELPAWAKECTCDFDYVYVVNSYSDLHYYHRIKFDKTTAVLEFTGRNTMVDNWKGPGLIKHVGGQIIGGSEILKHLDKNIIFLGRYAQWQHGIKTNQVLEKVYGTMEFAKTI